MLKPVTYVRFILITVLLGFHLLVNAHGAQANPISPELEKKEEQLIPSSNLSRDHPNEQEVNIDFASGASYQGKMKNGRYHYQGKVTYSDGLIYDGQFYDGLYHGQGHLIFPDGSSYIGTFKLGDFDGQGTLNYPNGDSYQGLFRENIPDGWGTFKSADGKTFEGHVYDKLFVHFGTLQSPNGSKYIGEFKNGNFDGLGVYESESKNTIIGSFSHGILNGHGLKILNNGDVFSAQFIRSKPHGVATLFTTKESEIRVDYYNKGILVKNLARFSKCDEKQIIQPCVNHVATSLLQSWSLVGGIGSIVGNLGLIKFKLSAGEEKETIYVGEMADHTIPHGLGTMHFPKTGTYVGSFASGKRHGYGMYLDYTGQKYEGTWLKGLKHGPGLLTLQNRTIIIGNFKNDDLDGLSTEFNERENSTSEFTYSNGVKDGLAVIRNNRDSLFMGSFLGGQKHGRWEQYSLPSKQLVETGTYERGQKIGIWQTFWGNGNLKRQVSFDNSGRPVNIYNED